MGAMPKIAAILFLLLTLSLAAAGQNQPNAPKQSPDKDDRTLRNQAPPRSDEDFPEDSHFPRGESSSSKDRDVDISPPKDDAAKHPYSRSAIEDGESGGDVKEFHPWDPHRAAKNVEVGDFYLKRKNYQAAEDRYREALVYKPNDAIATFRLAETLEKLGEVDEARQNYEAYLQILPEGPLSREAHQALDRLK
jgi:tetratricopeptide (TPR) repeat protein